MIKVELCGMALKATSFEIDDLLGKVGEVVERVPDGNWIVSFGHHRVYALPEHYLGETVLKIVYDDTHGTPPEPDVVKKSNAKSKKKGSRAAKPKSTAKEIKSDIPGFVFDGLETSSKGTILKKGTDGRSNLK